MHELLGSPKNGASRRTTVMLLGALSALGLLAVGCERGEVRVDTGVGNGGGDSGIVLLGDSGGMPVETDGGTRPVRDAGEGNACMPGCGPTESCGSGEGNGLDDNCNGEVDEGCMCTAGTRRECFAGYPYERNVGQCTDGSMLCQEFGTWGPCVGGVTPSDEVCDGVDNNCSGATDEELAGCTPPIQCPGFEQASPLSTHMLDGSRVYSGTDATAWAWSIECPSSVPAELCPTISNANSRDASVYVTSSGAYRVNVAVTLGDGSVQRCGWALYVRGGEGSLRVELNWDTMTTPPGTDLDLHLHRWTANTGESQWFGDDDCYFANCTPDAYTDPFGFGSFGTDWGLPNSALTNCQNAPHGGGNTWTEIGGCHNPRLDIDTNGGASCDASDTDADSSSFCAPENINIDNPQTGRPYRIAVNYYSNHDESGPTNAWVNIYCGGGLRASFGRDNPIYSFESAQGNGSGQGNASWIVADVVFFPGPCGLECRVFPINSTQTGAGFGPPWSCQYNASSQTCD